MTISKGMRKTLWALVHDRGNIFRSEHAGMDGMYPMGRLFERRLDAQAYADHMAWKRHERLRVVKVRVTLEVVV